MSQSNFRHLTREQKENIRMRIHLDDIIANQVGEIIRAELGVTAQIDYCFNINPNYTVEEE